MSGHISVCTSVCTTYKAISFITQIILIVFLVVKLGVDRLSASPILSILPIIDIGHFKNRFADNFYFLNFFMQTNILFTGDIIYWWINNTGETI